MPHSAHSIATSLHVNRGDRERELMHVLGPEGQGAPVEVLLSLRIVFLIFIFDFLQN